MVEYLGIWVPTNIGLPAEDDDYIVTCKGASRAMSLTYEEGKWTNGSEEFEVIAWMAFPDVYSLTE